jgi:hypothetical protein
MRLSDVKHPLTNAVASDGSIWVRVEAAKHLVSLGAVAPEVLDMLVTNSWSRPMTIIALESFASQIERMPISSKLLETRVPEYAKSPFTQVRALVAVGAPIWLPESELRSKILVELVADTNTNVWMAASNSLAMKSPAPKQNKRRMALSK